MLHTFCRSVLNDYLSYLPKYVYSVDELQPTLEVKILIVVYISLSNFMAGDGLESNTERLIRDSVSVVSGAHNQNQNNPMTNKQMKNIALLD